MRDHVMHLARNPQAFLGPRPPGKLLTRLLELGGPLLELGGPLLKLGGVDAAVVDEVAHQPGRSQDQRVPEPRRHTGPARRELDDGYGRLYHDQAR
jgi:hypothetical protein